MKTACVDFAAHAVHLVFAAPPVEPGSVTVDDLAALLGTVRDRLLLATTTALAAVPPPHAGDPVAVLRTNVLECAAALDQLHLDLGQQISRLRELEHENALARNDGG